MSDDKSAHELVIVRHHKGDHDEGHHGGVWKIAYADFMTAMMAFFLVMWLINAADKQTVSQIASYFNPLKLSDKVTSKKGVKELEQGDPDTGEQTEKTKGTSDKKEQPGHEVGTQKEGHGKAEGGKPDGSTAEGVKSPHSEQDLFKDPYNILSDLAAKAPKEKKKIFGEKRSIDDKGRGGDAFRDPFDPEFRRSPPKDVRELGKAPPSPEGLDDSFKLGGGSGATDDAHERSMPPAFPELAELNKGKETKNKEANGVTAQGNDRDKDRDKEGKEDKEAAAKENAKLEQALKKAIEGLEPGSVPNIEVRNTEEGRLISLTDQFDFGMFNTGSAQPRPELVAAMDKLGKIIAEQTGQIIVRGHTDGKPFKSPHYDNWRLSTARAQMTYHMLVRAGVPDKRFEAIEGFADRALRVVNDPGAAQNRRVEILLRKVK